jgi:hypothetical protein
MAAIMGWAAAPRRVDLRASLLFAQFGGLRSLREIVAGLGGARRLAPPSQPARALPLDPG